MKRFAICIMIGMPLIGFLFGILSARSVYPTPQRPARMKYNEEAKLRIQAVKVTEKRLEYSIWCFFGGGVAGMSGSIGIYAMQSPTNKKKTTSPPEDDLVEVLD